MLKGTDFILNPCKTEKEYQLVEVSQWTDYNTKEKVGFNYSVLFPKLQFEKIKVSVKSKEPIITNEELEQQGQITVTFENLKTWASVFDKRLNLKAEASAVKIAEKR